MREDGRVEESRVERTYLSATLADYHVEIKILRMLDSPEEGLQFVQDARDWLASRQRKAEIPKISDLGAVSVAEEVSVSKNEVDSPIRVAGKTQTNRISLGAFVKKVWPSGGDGPGLEPFRTQTWINGESDVRYPQTP